MGKKLDILTAIVAAGLSVVQAYGIIEDKRRARKNDLKDKKIEELEAQIAHLKQLQIDCADNSSANKSYK